MTNQELADQLNEALGLAETDAITVNVIRKWVDWGVLPKAIPIGQRIGSAPVWERGHGGLRQAVRLAELRKLGVRRKNAFIAQAYLEWGHDDFELVKKAILAEFIKSREQLNRRHITALDGQGYKDASAAKTRAIRNQLGPLDQRFVGTPLEQKPELYALVADAARFGNVEASRLAGLLKDSFAEIDPLIGDMISPESLTASMSAMAGLTGYEDEISNSGELTVRKATAPQFDEARQIYRLIGNISVPPEFENRMDELSVNSQTILELEEQLRAQISIGAWAIFQFVLILHFIANSPDLERSFLGFPTNF